jgi:hypothetical protein
MRAADNDTPSLPEAAAELRALLLEALAQVGTLVAERDALVGQNERLQHLLLKLKRRQFGAKSERLPEEQLLFAFEESRRRWPGTRPRRANNLPPCATTRPSVAGLAAAGCPRICRASRWCWRLRQRPVLAARARWSRSASTPRSG